MEKIKIKTDQHAKMMFDILMGGREIKVQDFINNLDQDLFNEIKEKYDDPMEIVYQCVDNALTYGDIPLKHDDKFFNDCFFIFEHQVKEYFYCWKPYANGSIPFGQDCKYRKLYGYGFGDHIIHCTNIKQKPMRLYEYIERNIIGDYFVKFANGIRLDFEIRESLDGEITVENKRFRVESDRFYKFSTLSVYQLLYFYHKLGLRPSRNKIIHKLLRNVLTVMYDVYGIKETS